MKRAVAVLLLLIANILFASSRVTPPDTAPGKLLQEWLAAYNAADAAALRQFAEQRYTLEARGERSAEEIAEAQMQGRQTTGGLDLVRVESSSPVELAVIVRAKSAFPRMNRLSLKVSEPDPSLLVERKSVVVPPSSEELDNRKAPAEFAKEIDAKFGGLAQKDEFSGAALIARDGQTIWQQAYGFQDREKQVPANLETRFRLGSMNKMFTSVAIAQFVEAGKLKFKDTLRTALPDYPNKEIAQQITIEQLLTHTSGLGDIFGPGFFEKKDSIREHKDYLPLFVDKPLQFEPGARFSYSNAGFIVLGLVIEKFSGQSYYEYVKQHIFDPAGMAAGGGESNVGDLLRFANALRGYKVLSRETTELITSGKVGDQPGNSSKYAYGFADRNANGRRTVGHSGGAPGMNGSLNILWDEGYTVIVLANVDPTVAQDAAEFIADRLPAAARVARQ